MYGSLPSFPCHIIRLRASCTAAVPLEVEHVCKVYPYIPLWDRLSVTPLSFPSLYTPSICCIDGKWCPKAQSVLRYPHVVSANRICFLLRHYAAGRRACFVPIRLQQNADFAPVPLPSLLVDYGVTRSPNKQCWSLDIHVA